MASVRPAPYSDDIGNLLEEIASIRIALKEAVLKNAEERLRSRIYCSELNQTIACIREGRWARRTSPSKAHDARLAVERLTPREQEVLRLIAEGLSTKQIAGKLNISFKTAVTHRSNILEKLDIHESATLVRLAVAAGLVAA